MKQSKVSADENKATVKRYIDDLNRRRYAVLDEVVAEEVVLGSLGLEGAHQTEIVTRQTYRSMIEERIRIFPDYQVTIEGMVAEEDLVVLHWTHQGTQRGEFMGVHPTGKVVRGAAIGFYRMAQGRIVGVRGIWDRAEIWAQLGLLPPELERL